MIELRFYFNDQIDVCAEERWVVDYLIENGFCETEEEAIDNLRTCRNFYGWFDCEVSDTIAELFNKYQGVQ
jgi:hypothetical protein